MTASQLRESLAQPHRFSGKGASIESLRCQAVSAVPRNRIASCQGTGEPELRIFKSRLLRLEIPAAMPPAQIPDP